MQLQVYKTGMTDFLSKLRFLAVILSVTAFLSCRKTVEVSALGRYDMKTEFGRYSLELLDHQQMKETVVPGCGEKRTITETWIEDKSSVLLTPFIEPDPIRKCTPMTLRNAELTKGQDRRGRLQLVVSDDFGWWFEKN
jgi:hypothetical protein